MVFKGQYDFLSNFYERKLVVNGITYRNAESAFQSFKLINREERVAFSKLDGREAKALGRKVPLRPDWDEIRLPVMEGILRKKFADDELRFRLSLVDGPITEDNTWNDRFWGVCKGVGENNLGRLLMKIRDGE